MTATGTDTRDAALHIRPAEFADVEAIVRLHEADAVGGHGDAWSEETAPRYRAAFAAIAQTRCSTLYVAVLDGAVVGTFQLTLVPQLTGRGALRGTLKSVQVRDDLRSRGIGAEMIAEAMRLAGAAGAKTLDLTSNKRRTDAHRFYERLGFARSHEGFKISL